MDENKILNPKDVNCIENIIEKKFNDVLKQIPITDLSVKKSNNYINISLYDIYKNTLQTIIDIINDILELLYESNYITDYNVYYTKLYNIFFRKDRIFYLGIIILILGLILILINY